MRERKREKVGKLIEKKSERLLPESKCGQKKRGRRKRECVCVGERERERKKKRKERNLLRKRARKDG